MATPPEIVNLYHLGKLLTGYGEKSREAHKKCRTIEGRASLSREFGLWYSEPPEPGFYFVYSVKDDGFVIDEYYNRFTQISINAAEETMVGKSYTGFGGPTPIFKDEPPWTGTRLFDFLYMLATDYSFAEKFFGAKLKSKKEIVSRIFEDNHFGLRDSINVLLESGDDGPLAQSIKTLSGSYTKKFNGVTC